MGVSSWAVAYVRGVTFADTVLHLVRAGARIDTWTGPNGPHPAEDSGADATGQMAVEGALSAAFPAPSDTLDEGHPIELAEAAEDLHRFEPGLADLEAAVGLVSSGLAKRVVLSGFPSWPGLLWRAYQLADTADVLILPTLVRPGGKVDIVITRDAALNG
jgi:hypothetical protein